MSKIKPNSEQLYFMIVNIRAGELGILESALLSLFVYELEK